MSRPDGYDVDGYIHFIEKVSDKANDVIEESGSRKMPDKEMYEIDFNYIEKLNLNKIGNEIPSLNRNVWNVDRYMGYYWKAIMDADCIFVWHQLWEYCDADNGVDICYPKMSELAQRCSMAKGTLISKIKKLEENNFLIQIHRLNKNRGMKEDSPVFKLRRTIPLLSKEQVAKLNPYLQEKHKDYMDKFASDTALEFFSQKGEETKQEVIDTVGDFIVTKKRRKEVEEMLENDERLDYIKSNLPAHMADKLMEASMFLEKLENKGMSKPSRDTYFKDSIVAYDAVQKQAIIIFPNETIRDFTKENLSTLSQDVLMEVLIDAYEDVYNYKYLTAKQFIINVLKGK